MKETVFDMEGNEKGEIDLTEEMFGLALNKSLLYDALKAHFARARLGTAASRNRALVSGSTAKIYKQKGTGRARHSDRRANIFVGGGKSFGPHPRDYSYHIPRKARRAALCVALADKKRNGKLKIIDKLELKSKKTREAAALLGKLNAPNCLIVTDSSSKNLVLAARNIPNVKLIDWKQMNVYEVLHHDWLLISQDLVAKLQEMLTK